MAEIKKKSEFKNIIIENRQARHEYFVDDTIECGISLVGNEVKSIRAGMANLKTSWIDIQEGEMYLKGMHVSAWETTNKFDIDENRDRKLLVHKKEIRQLSEKIKQAGKTLVPLKVYFNDRGKCKVLVGICTGKKLYDKRQTEKEASMKRDALRDLK